MPEVNIRPAIVSDLPYLVKIEHVYQSHYVWQMDRTIADGQLSVQFRLTRLPRPVRVEHTGSHPLLDEDNWSRNQAVLVSTVEQDPVGYISMSGQFAPKTLWVTDCAVRQDVRRNGIGTSLILAAQEWGLEHGYRRVILEMQSKNHPAILLARKLGYEFCGYNDHYFANQDIALFFSKPIR